MVDITFESHGTTYDNEADMASGWFDVDLSPLGERQAAELGERYANVRFDAVFVPDLKRAVRTANIAFANRKFHTVQDARLRECNYGQLNRRPKAEIDSLKAKYISNPFPGGQSYEQTSENMKSFFVDLLKNYDGTKVLIIGCRATQYGLEHWIRGVPLLKAIIDPWKWQPGWKYNLEKI